MNTRAVLVVFCVGSLLAALPPAAHAQDGSRGLAEQLSGGGGRGGVPKIVLVGLGLTTLSMLILIVVLATARNRKEQSVSRAAGDAALEPEGQSEGGVEATPAPEPEPVEGVAWVICPRCNRFVADFVELRRDALSCPWCSDVLRPAPVRFDSAGGPGREEGGG